MEAPFHLARPMRHVAPLVLASPHSGRDYPEALAGMARLDAHALRGSEDCHVDRLFAAGPQRGAPLLSARFPRVWCDANRGRWELDPNMFTDQLPPFVDAASPRATAGLGTIPRVVGRGEPIYRRRLRFEEARARIEACWAPYHAALEALVAGTAARFGACLLLDCHSMPGPHPRAAQRRDPDFVLGDAHGGSCAPRVIDAAASFLARRGYRVARNDPYAGGYCTRHYGRPREGRHALQIEIARRLYMDERTLAPNRGFAALQADLDGLVDALRCCIP